jgi:hypothetical protein
VVNRMNWKSEASARFAERRRQEDAAPRLSEVVPELLSCRIEITQRRSNVTSADVSHTRHVVVERAPALFLVPCYEPSCKDGGHDITSALLRGLRDREANVQGEDTCHGSVGAEHCRRVLHFNAVAQYKPPT